VLLLSIVIVEWLRLQSAVRPGDRLLSKHGRSWNTRNAIIGALELWLSSYASRRRKEMTRACAVLQYTHHGECQYSTARLVWSGCGSWNELVGGRDSVRGQRDDVQRRRSTRLDHWLNANSSQNSRQALTHSLTHCTTTYRIAAR